MCALPRLVARLVHRRQVAWALTALRCTRLTGPAAMLQVFGCRKKMSAIAILDYSGAEGLFKEMEKLAEQGRQEWESHHQQVHSVLRPCS